MVARREFDDRLIFLGLMVLNSDNFRKYLRESYYFCNVVVNKYKIVGLCQVTLILSI